MGEIFVSHASGDGDAAVLVAAALRQAGHRPFLDTDCEDGISPGQEWRRKLFRELHLCDAVVFLNGEASQASVWCHTELAIAAEHGKRTYSLDVSPDLHPHPLLEARQGIRLQTDVGDSIRRLIDQLRRDGLAEWRAVTWDPNRAPYPGLAVMDIKDAGVFFGRARDIRNLITRVDRPLGQRDGDLVVVIGPSGAGKSSLVRAGLAARLKAPPTDWAVIDPFEPGAWPLDRLIGGLVALSAGQLSETDCRDWLATKGLGAAADWLVNHNEPRARRLLVTLDQGEQLATVTQAAERAAFVETLGQGLAAGSPLTVVMTVRSDRFDEIQRLPILGPKITEPVIVGPMDRGQLAAVIEGPAKRADLNFDAGLVGRLIDDAMRGSTSEAVDALPLLAFTLREMYDVALADGRQTITEADYERVGRIDGAIALRAGVAEAALPPDSKPILELLLPRFVTLSEERLPAGRPVARQQLNSTENDIVRTLEDQRLLTGTRDTVRLAHEQLIRAWPALADAVAGRRDDLMLESRLERQANDWKHGAGALLGRDATRVATRWLERISAAPDQTVRDFVRASQTASRRRYRLAIGVLSMITILAIAAATLGGFAISQRNTARSQLRLALSRRVTAQSLLAFQAGAVDRGALLGLEAHRLAPTAEARGSLIRALEATRYIREYLPGHTGEVHGVAFSPDGKTLASASDDNTIMLWDAATGKALRTLRGHTARVYRVEFSPDGKTLASASRDRTIMLWDAATGNAVRILRGHTNTVYGVAFSPDGKTLASSSGDKTVSLWDTATGQQLRTLVGHTDKVLSVVFSPDGKTIASASGDKTIILWDATTGRLVRPLTGHAGIVYSAEFSPDGKTLASASDDKTVIVWDATTGRPVRTLTGHSGRVVGVAFSPDGRTIASASGDNTVRLWDAATGQQSLLLLGHTNTVNTVTFSPDGKTLASGGNDNAVALWDTTTGGLPTLHAHTDSVNAVAFSPDGKTLATGSSDKTIILWNPATGQRVVTLVGHTGKVFAVAFSPDGKTIASGSGDNTIILWDTATGQRVRTLIGHTAKVVAVAFSPDGKTIASGSGVPDDTIIVWDTATGRPVRTLRGDANQVNALAFSPDGRSLATANTITGSGVGTIILWDTTTGHRARTLRGHTNAVNAVAFSPDGQTLASASTDYSVILWDTSTGRRARRLSGHNDTVNAVAFSPDGQTIASASNDNTIILWDAATGQEFGEGLRDHTDTVNAVTFSRDGKTLASGSTDHTVILWTPLPVGNDTGAIRERICSIVRRNLTPLEWRQFLPGQPYHKTCPAWPVTA